MAERYVGPWADYPTSAVTNALNDVNVNPLEYVECTYADGSVRLVPIDPDRPHHIAINVTYSQARDQYRATLRRHSA